MRLIPIVYAVLTWGIIALGVLHMASTPRALTPSAVWFFTGGVVWALAGGLNLLNRTYGGMAPGLRWFCVGTNVAITAVTLVAGSVTGASVAGLVVIGRWMAATLVLSLVPSAAGTSRPRSH